MPPSIGIAGFIASVTPIAPVALVLEVVGGRVVLATHFEVTATAYPTHRADRSHDGKGVGEPPPPAPILNDVAVSETRNGR